MPKNIAQQKQNIKNTPTTVQINSQNTVQKQSLWKLHEDISSKTQVSFTKPVINTLQDKVQTQLKSTANISTVNALR